ncbi:hypothetical protein LINPERHAP2_LOCUS20680 [Linum perenne]
MLRKYKELLLGKQEKYMLNHEDLSEERLEKMKKALKNQLMEMQLVLKEDLPTSCGGDLDFGAKGKLNGKREIVKDLSYLADCGFRKWK